MLLEETKLLAQAPFQIERAYSTCNAGIMVKSQPTVVSALVNPEGLLEQGSRGSMPGNSSLQALHM